MKGKKYIQTDSQREALKRIEAEGGKVSVSVPVWIGKGCAAERQAVMAEVWLDRDRSDHSLLIVESDGRAH